MKIPVQYFSVKNCMHYTIIRTTISLQNMIYNFTNFEGELLEYNTVEDDE